MKHKKPIIGVSGPDKGGGAAWWFTRFALWIHEAKALRIQPKNGLPDTHIHGLIIGGGADINPEWYGSKQVQEFFKSEKRISGVRQFLLRLGNILFFPLIFLIRKLFSTKTVSVDKARDELEFQLLEEAIKRKIPVLGICRGAQLINIHQGGTLHGDISNFYNEIPKVHSIWPKKKVKISQKSMLFDILDSDYVWVNALHHQAVDEIGSDLIISAKEQSGIVQAIEYHGNQFLIGVQWHPEYLPQIPLQRRIFKVLVDRAKDIMRKTKM